MKKNGLFVESLENRSLLTPVIAIIDSGIDLTHTALQSYIWKNPGEIVGNNIDDDGNGYIDDINGWNFSNNTNVVQDNYGHGTHVSGIVSGYGPLSIMSLKFQNDSGVGFTGDAISAINYAVMMRVIYKVDIVAINNSWGGGTGYSLLLENAIKSANDAGIVFVVAAGNSGSDNDLTPRYPSSYNVDNVISVAAVTSTQQLAGFSNYGQNSVDIGAWGTSVYSTLPHNTYGYMSGTSMAAPQVSGAIAAICDKYPTLRISEIKTLLFSSVGKMDALSSKVSTGGVLNISGALGDPSFKVILPSAPISAPVIIQSWNDRVVSGIDILNIHRVRGWVLDSNNPSDKVRVKILINNRVAYSVIANGYRSDLAQWSDKNHNFDLRLNRKLLHRGWNSIKLIAEDTLTREIKVIAIRNIRRIY